MVYKHYFSTQALRGFFASRASLGAMGMEDIQFEDQPGELTVFLSKVPGISEQLFVADRT